jgi:large subunit ribosomal protein L25
VTVTVSLEFFGAPEAAKKSGTVVVHELADIQVRCKVRDIPEHVRVDMTTMTGETFTAGDLKFAPGTELATDPHAVIVRVQTVKEEAAAEAATPGAAAAAPAAAPAAEKKDDKK